MHGNHYSLTSLKQAVKYLLGNCFFKGGSQNFQVIGFLFANLFLFRYKSKGIGKLKRFGHIYTHS